jgi:hypothetical protein
MLRVAGDLEIWLQRRGMPARAALSAEDAAGAAKALDIAPREIRAAWRVASAVRDADADPGRQPAQAGTGTAPGLGWPGLAAVLASAESDAVLRVWETALAEVLDPEELDGIATALYTAGGPVGMDALFDAFGVASGDLAPGRERAQADPGLALSRALETLADIGVVEIGMRDDDSGLTVALSPLGAWGLQRRLAAQGWPVPAAGATAGKGAGDLLAGLTNWDAEVGEAEINAWLAAREPHAAAAELIEAAASGSPGRRGAAFAVLDRIGMPALDHVRAALVRPLLRAHAAVWLAEHGEDAPIEPEDRAWLLVDLGAGLLEEASPQDVVAELLPDVPAVEQAEIVAGLWRVQHPAVTSLLTTLSDHHPEPRVARAARKAAFKARSPAPARSGAGSGQRRS